MKTKHLLLVTGIIIFISAEFLSCKYPVNPHFRQIYSNHNHLSDKDSTRLPFFKIHFHNGDVSLIENWYLNESKDSIFGKGSLYNFNRKKINTGDLAFDVDEIAIIETNQLAALKSKDQDRIAGLAVMTGIYVGLDVLCITNPKICFGSCPTFYLDGKNYVHSSSAEGFSSSIAPSLEKSDLDALRHQTDSEDFYITMKNEAYETHAVNQLAVHAVAKKKTENVFQDAHGNFFITGGLKHFKSGFADGKPADKSLSRLDDLEYVTTTDSFELSEKETIILNFDDLKETQHGIVINFRQSLLTTFLLYNGISYMGDEFGYIFAKLERSNRIKKQLDGLFDRLGKIELSVWDENSGKWIFTDALFETGPIAQNLMISPIENIKPKGGKLKVKVELTKGLWRLDYMGLTAIHAQADPYVSQPEKIQVLRGENRGIDKLKSDDNDYFIAFPGDEYRFKFEFPKPENGCEYELFLETKGYYLEWIRQDWLKDKNLQKLRKMLSNDDKTWKALAREFKSVEHELEEMFWNSKYTPIQ